MAGELINSTELFQEVTEPLMQMFGPLVTILKAVTIVVLIYFIFLLIKALFRWRDSSRLKNIHREISEMNRKMDVLISSKKKETQEDKTAKKSDKRK